MRTFSDDDKVEKEFKNNYFDFGVHRILLMQFEHGGFEEGEKEYVEITVCDPDDDEINEKVRVWFTTDNAANFSFNTLRALAVHNAKEADKDKARNAVDGCNDAEELTDLLNKKIIGGEGWLTKYPDPKRTYLDGNGITRQSINKNLYAYEPKERTDLMPDKMSADDRAEKKTTVQDLGGEDITGTEAAKGIPEDWSK